MKRRLLNLLTLLSLLLCLTAWVASYPFSVGGTFRIRAANAGDAILLKQVRMRALADAPYAFGGPNTLSHEQALPDEYWQQLARELAGEVAEWRDRCVCLMLVDGDDVCATA